MTDQTRTIAKVVVIGGGYSGTIAANRLRKRADVDVALVNPRPSFVQRLRLHQFVAGTAEATADYDTLLADGVRLVVDEATRIDTAARTVRLASGDALRYDYVIYAVGSTAATPPSVPGAAEFSYPIAEWEHAQRLRAALGELAPEAPVTVVGGGLTGIETAAELTEQGYRVTLVCGGELAPTFSARGRRFVAKWLAGHGVEVIENVRVAEVLRKGAVLADGTTLPGAVTIWTAGFGVPELAASSGLRTDPLGRLITDETLTSLDDERVLAAGDAAAPSNQPLRMSCQAAGPLGAIAAETVLSRIDGAEPARLDTAFLGSNVSLGRKAGITQVARKDDTAVGFYVGGRIGAHIKEAATKGTMWGIRREARKPGSLVWFKGGRRPEQAVFAPGETAKP
ncbi:FAD-dependent oxidoreductase [Amycolatopsis cynarae]|uniref:FAD-dependent oxidoreductase n=1 Tax=Amycolatopsis cynarae TaxID=2995223 RepID=A0ABY7B5I8_9PSEU|nr:FAD-dependent oxidoreductase [Amycolatopsis sp. HUAS 11-8]WAL66166.1 FAD-dependent oxidoreductase [Amycolatopsis sp. HUAS 11-8]